MTPKITQQVAPRNGRRTVRARYSNRGAINHTTAALVFGVAAVAIVGMLGFFYLQQVVQTASQGTDIHQLEATLIELKEKQRVLELKGAELRSLQNVEQDVEKMNLVPTDKVSYLAPIDDRVAFLSDK